MPSHQSSLDGFFGVKTSKKTSTKQTTLRGFVQTKTNGAITDKENKKKDDDVKIMKVDKKEPVTTTAASKLLKKETKRASPKSAEETLAKRRRRAIEDDDDDDDDDKGNRNKISDKEYQHQQKDNKSHLKTNNEEIGDQKKTVQTKQKQQSPTKHIQDETTAKKETKIPATRNSKPKMQAQKETKQPVTSQATTTTEEEATKPTKAPTKLQEQWRKRASNLLKALNKSTSSTHKTFKTNDEILKEKQQPPSNATTIAETPYAVLVDVFDKIQAITGRLEIQGILTDLFRFVLLTNPKDLYAIVYLASNSVAPAYECVELGIGDSILIKAIGEAFGTSPAMVRQKYEDEGDLGTVAQTCKSKQRTLAFGLAKPKPLSTSHVLQVFREIAAITGSQSQKLKVDKIKKLLVKAQQPAATKYIIRGLQGKLRIGLAQSTVLISLAHSLALTIPDTIQTDGEEWSDNDDDEALSELDSSPPSIKLFIDESQPPEKRLEAAVNIVKQVYSEVPSYNALLDAALSVPLVNLHKACSFQPGIPVAPMLAKPTKSIQEVLKRLDGLAFTCEYKYDGERAQIHKTSNGKLKVFSRNLLDTTVKYPEVPLFVEEAAKAATTASATDNDKDGTEKATTVAESFVLDAEVVAYNPKSGQLVPFQVLSTRKKSEESAETAKVQVIVKAFDLMYLNGASLLNKSLSERRNLLRTHFAAVEGKFQFATYLDSIEDGDTTALEDFLDTAVKGQCEGLMVKTMDDVYEPSRRSLNWLKLKKDYLEGLGDSLDLVPLGAYFGRGKRTGVYGAYLLACYDEETEEFQSVCKLGTGFSDEDLKTLSQTLNKHKLEGGKSSQYNVADALECDVWFDAVQVWEVKAADLSKSSVHRGATGKLTGDGVGRGIGLRFPRFERIREDKKPEEATTSDQVLEMYYQQDTVNGQDDGDGGDDEDGI